MDNARRKTIVSAMDHDVIIAGGGLNGCTLALALASGGLDVALVDPVPVDTRGGAEFDGRSYALSAASRALLGALGLWPGLADGAQPILDIRISDGTAGTGPSPLTLEFDHAQIEEGPMGFMVEDRHLRPALLDAIDKDARITAITGVCWWAATGAARPPRSARASAGPGGSIRRTRWSPPSATSDPMTVSPTSSSCPRGRWPSCR